MENGSLSSESNIVSGSTLSDDDRLYYFLTEGDFNTQWARDQMAILNRIRYITEEQKNVNKDNNPFFQQCPKCGKFTSYNALDHDCYQDRCALCGRWSSSKHVCNIRRCPACGEFSHDPSTHICQDRWEFRCMKCGVFTGSKREHKCR